MPQQPATEDIIYSWIDESGRTHYSNFKVPKDLSKFPAKDLSKFPAKNLVTPNEPVNKTTKANLQILPKKPIKPPPHNGVIWNNGTLLTCLAIVIFLRLLLQSSKKRKRQGKKKREFCLSENSTQTAPMQPDIHFFGKETASYNDIVRPEHTFTHEPEVRGHEPGPSWGLEFIQSLEWREFEKLCARILQEKGYCAKLGDIGPDGGVDIHIYRENGELEQLTGIAQCKAQRKPIKIDIVKAFRWTMASKHVEKGYFFTSGEFYKHAKQFCEKENIEMITGTDLLETIKKLPEYKQAEILNGILATDYTTHICVRCGIKMVRRTNQTTAEEFWGCVNFPRCKNIIQIRKNRSS